MIITSPSNPKVKEVVALHRKKERDQTGLILVESKHPVEEAIQAGLKPNAIFILEGWASTLPSAIEAIQVSEAAMARMSTTNTPPVCLGVFEKPETDLEATLQPHPALLIVLDQVQDPGNLGTLIRSAAAFGATGLISTGPAADLYNPKVIRASAGLLFSLTSVGFEKPIEELMPWLQSKNLQIFSTSSHTQTSYREVNYQSPSVLLFGNEGTGLPEVVLSAPQITPLTIPMAPHVESLNVAITGSIILAETASQRALPL